MYLKSLTDFDFAYIRSLGFKNVLIDLDNTLAPYYERRIDEKALNFLDALTRSGFFVVVMSNNTGERVKEFLEGTDYEWMNSALKPTKIGYKRVIAKYGLAISETLTIGDQILTDIWGANRMGLYSILVKPLVQKDGFSTRINRIFERFLIRKGIVRLNEKM